jgi:hypothetical protein
MTADQPAHTAVRPSPDGRNRNETPEQLRADVERVRAELGETVAALAGKADIKARAKNATRRTTANLAEQARNLTPAQGGIATAVAAVAAGATAATIEWRRRSRGGHSAARWRRIVRK